MGPAPVTSKVVGCHTARAMADTFGVVPGLGEDAGGLEQDAEHTQAPVDLDGEFRSDTETLGAVTVPLLDAALGVAPVAAHVPLAGGAGDARLRVGTAHDADNEVARRHAAVLGRRLDLAERFMAEHETWLARRSRAVDAGQDFAVGCAHAQRQGAHQNRAIRVGRFGDLIETCRIGDAGRDGDSAHHSPWIWIAWNCEDDISTPERKKSSRGRETKIGPPALSSMVEKWRRDHGGYRTQAMGDR